ncbi:MAG: hypothetical protein CR982_00760 [Candidatus Cloacimonadota bacterium]|nr:MAG: hypothetical protein CR982_00760 [Candidatus Cloacimonadota bacterium]PIE79766.1 MAG: hypothetical protein CSA15_02665 [Candidatus Delongbacteria bacterium]
MKLLGAILVSLLTLASLRADGLENLDLEYKYSEINSVLIAEKEKAKEEKTIGRSILRNEYRDGKSPLIASGLSILVPGAGEIYGEDYIRAGIFLGLEATFLGVWYTYENDGDDKTDKFHDYADIHFSEEKYFTGINLFLEQGVDAGLATTPFDSWTDVRDHWESGDHDSLFVSNQLKDNLSMDEFGHKLPDTKTQQYYEMIGKYHQFSLGWDDFNGMGKTDDDKWVFINNLNYTNFSNNEAGNYLFDSKGKRDNYESMRNEANEAYEFGQNFLMLTIVNHVVSAFDAAYVIKSDWSLESKIRVKQTNKDESLGLDNFKLEYTLTF